MWRDGRPEGSKLMPGAPALSSSERDAWWREAIGEAAANWVRPTQLDAEGNLHVRCLASAYSTQIKLSSKELTRRLNAGCQGRGGCGGLGWRGGSRCRPATSGTRPSSSLATGVVATRPGGAPWLCVGGARFRLPAGRAVFGQVR
ncbi:DciA family protein [Streptomyces sp. NPDC091377]|uniref:DciA family protein n=1 Tax=Streptomyces sp. NPDC091377 TaxID=3365995 RepID=UPI00381C2BC0